MADRVVDATARSDAELITAVRVGDAGAYEELYRRHVDAAMAVGRHLTRSRADAEDVVSEAFARVLSALQRGAGPEMAFRPYLLTSVRNAFYDRTRKDKRLDVTDDVPEDPGRILAAAATSEEDVERQLAATVFASLPERWQLVLWHTEVEGRTPAEVAPLLGLAPNAVAALAYRAREGLRQAYLNAHIQARPPAGCADIVPKLGAYVREDLSNRDRRKVDEHLKDCERCQAIVVELEEAGSRLKILLIPVIAGIPAAAYLGSISSGAAGALAVLAARVSRRFKELGPAGQVAAVVSAVAAAGVLVVGAVAAAQALTGHDEAPSAASAGDGGSGAGGGGGSGSGSGGGVGGGGGGGGGGAGAGGGSTGGGGAGPGSTSAPPTATTAVPGALTTAPPTAPPVAPTAAPTVAPTAAPPVPPTVPTIPPTTPPTTPAPASLSVSFGPTGPAYAGLSVAIPISIGNGAPAAAFGRALAVLRQGGPANQPTVTIPLPTGVAFGSIDNAAWTCSVSGTTLQCVLPGLAPGASSSAIVQLALDAAAPSPITIQASVSDGSGPPVAGPPLVITVQPPPAGVSDVVVDRADLALTGNAIVTCNPTAVSTCTVARDDPAHAPGQVDKSQQRMIWLDVDGDATTFNSSSATLALPAGAEVLSARLYWGGNGQAGTGGVAPPNPAGRGTVRLSPPGAAVPVAVTASTVSPDPSNAARYFAIADVTGLVSAAGAGTYTAADLQVATGTSSFGGWALQVVYRDPAAPLRMIALTGDQVTTINSGGSGSIVLTGLTPSAVPQPATLSFVALEGDFGIVPEKVTVNSPPLSNAANAPNNPFNGSVTTAGARSPAYVNNFGFDADQFAVTVPAGQSELRVDITSAQDRFRIAGVGLSVTLSP